MTVEMSDASADIDFSDLEARFAPSAVPTEPELHAVLVIDHLPAVDRKKEEKLLAVLAKNIFAPAKAVPVPGSLMMPRDAETDLSKGYLFVEFENAEQAIAALSVANGYRLDKSHVLSATLLGDFPRIMAIDPSVGFVVPEEARAPAVEKEHLRSWLADPFARDQFVTLTGTSASVCWNVKSSATGGGQPEVVHTRANWTDSYVQWSPRGAYLASLHPQGVMLWGGASFSRLSRFLHPGVQLLAFSTTEAYMVSWSPANPLRPGDANLLVWEVASARLIRSFVHSGKSAAVQDAWPLVKFSFDDQSAARVVGGCDSSAAEGLAFYQMPAMQLVARSVFAVDNLVDFCWSPADPSIVYWTRGSDDIPARVALLGPAHDPATHSRPVLRTKNLFNVLRIQVHWHALGDFLCVQVERHSKNKKRVFSSIELFRIRSREIPVETVEFPEDTPLTVFCWEPVDANLGGTPVSARFMVASVVGFTTTMKLYAMDAAGGGSTSAVQMLYQAARKTALDRFKWSPRGEFMVLVGGVETSSTSLEFVSWGARDLLSMATREHYQASDVAWDPSGRYVASWVSSWTRTSEHGYCVWDVRGEQRIRVVNPRLAYFAWRPRPPTLLGREQLREVRRKLKDYALQFEETDLAELSLETSSSAQLKSRQVLMWNEWRRHCRRDCETRAARRRALLGAADGSDAAGDAAAANSASVEHWVEDEILDETVVDVAAVSKGRPANDDEVDERD